MKFYRELEMQSYWEKVKGMGSGKGPLGLGPIFMKFLKLRLMTLLLNEFVYTVFEFV